MAAVLAIAPASAAAQGSTEVLVPRCPSPFGGESLARLLRLELSLAGVDAFELVSIDAEPPPHPEGLLRVRLRAPCDSTDSVIIAVTGGPGAPSVHQVLDLGEVDDTMRPRAMAVAVAEQVRLQRLLVEHEAERGAEPDVAEVQSRATPERTRSLVVPVPSRAAPAPAPAAAPPAPSGAFWIALSARGFPAQSTWPLGLRVGLALDLLAPLRIGLDAGAAFAAADHASGGAELWLLTGGLFAGARLFVVPELALAPGVRLDVGYATLAGYPDDAATRRGQGPSVALLGALRADWILGDRVALFADVELGATLVANQGRAGDEVVVIGTEGLAFGARAGFALTL